MQYNTYKFTELDEEDRFTINVNGTEFVVKDNISLSFGGAVGNYNINNDYMIDNNSVINIITETEAVAGQLIAIIDDTGAYDTGIITSVDNKTKTITYKGLLELFNQEMLNPYRSLYTEDDDEYINYEYDAINDTGLILASYFLNTNDKNLRIPLVVRTSGGTDLKAIWNFKENSFNLKEWLINLFNDKNIVLQLKIVFEVNRGYIDCLILQNTSGGVLIKNDIASQKIVLNETQTNQDTVCAVVDSETKELLSQWYLLQNNTISENANAINRVMPYKLIVSELNTEENVSEQQAAEEKLLYKEFNNYTEISVDKKDDIYKNLIIGDSVTIVPEIFDMKQNTEIITEYDKYLIDSVYTGRKENGSSSKVTYIFGKSRVNYTDIIQQEKLKLRRK